MRTEATTRPHLTSESIGQTIRELQSETLGFILPFFAVCGYLVLVSFGLFWHAAYADLSATILIVLPVIVWHLRKRNYVASVWLLVLAAIGIDLFISVAGPFDAVICLLVLPVGIATVYIGVTAGLLTATGASVSVLLLQHTVVGHDPLLTTVALTAIWGVVGLIWLTNRPLQTAMEWYSVSYDHGRQLLVETRDIQQQLGETLEDLANANIQLTRLNSLSQALRRAAEEARTTKERFVANVSHELRTPLNMIIGFSEMMVQTPDIYHGTIPAKLMADLDVILRNSEHLSRLVDDVLDLSQIDAGEMALTRERVSIAKTIQAARVAVRPLFESKSLYLRVSIPKDLPAVYCDRTRIRQVVINLLSNAGRFTKYGGVTVTARQDDGSVVISVADTGTGIATETKERIFEPFHQLDGTVRRRYGGSGLGLSISRKFIEMHGGTIWFESAEGKGATFSFSLPIDPPISTEPGAVRWFSPYLSFEERTRPSRAPVPVERPRFVVQESGGTLRRMLVRYLDNIEVESVNTSDQAMAELTRTPAQALIVNTPSVSDTLQQITESVTLPYGIPAIICSVPGTQTVAQDMGVVDYLVKPVSRELLLNTVRALVPNKGTLLIVDDEPDVLRLFRRVLISSDRNYRVLAAADAEEALNLSKEQRPDAILLDLMIPNKDGFWFLAQKAKDPAIADVPVVVVSALDPEGQPIVSNAIAVTRGGELSVRQLLRCMQDIISNLSAGASTANLGYSAAPVD